MLESIFPLEVIDIILSFCDYKSAARLGQTCRAVNGLYKRQKKKLDDKIPSGEQFITRLHEMYINVDKRLNSELLFNNYSITGFYVFEILFHIINNKKIIGTTLDIFLTIILTDKNNKSTKRKENNFAYDMNIKKSYDNIYGLYYDGKNIICNISPILFTNVIYRRYTNCKFDKFLFEEGYIFDDYETIVRKYLHNRVLVHKRNSITFTIEYDDLNINIVYNMFNLSLEEHIYNNNANKDYKYKLRLYEMFKNDKMIYFCTDNYFCKHYLFESTK